MADVEEKISESDFAEGLTEAIKEVFANAQHTKLFVTGYPGFWNHHTDYCDNISFKLNCLNNYVLPLTKERRKKMNDLTDLLNTKIKTIIDNWPTRADLGMCEEGVKEPSYRNPNIWFYPLEYSTGSVGTIRRQGHAIWRLQRVA
jgi:hypothetical protein